MADCTEKARGELSLDEPGAVARPEGLPPLTDFTSTTSALHSRLEQKKRKKNKTGKVACSSQTHFLPPASSK